MTRSASDALGRETGVNALLVIGSIRWLVRGGDALQDRREVQQAVPPGHLRVRQAAYASLGSDGRTYGLVGGAKYRGARDAIEMNICCAGNRHGQNASVQRPGASVYAPQLLWVSNRKCVVCVECIKEICSRSFPLP